MQTRKQFLINSLSLASGAALLGFKMPVQPEAPYITFDLHCHPGKLFAHGGNEFGENFPPEKTLGDMNAAHLSGAFFALVADSKLLKPGPAGISIVGQYQAGEAWQEYKLQLREMKDFLFRNNLIPATTAKELTIAGPLAPYIAVEGGDFLESQADKLEEAYDDGVRCIQLVHYVPNTLGDLQTAAAVHNGLSEFGKAVVRKMNRLGMLVDVAHASYQTTKDVASATDAPIMLSHSILEMETGRPIAKRAISKEHAKLVADTGGIIGAWPSGFNKSFDEFADNTLRLVDAVGIDHVGIGTDMDGNFKPVLSTYTQYPTFAETLKNKGLAANEVEKIMGGNAAALLKKVLKKR
ncbi:MAG TPA: membrane dipeptidase [Panacibacter sp.]|nr:membrane dipeptidase [Panacibacter sp.]HNP43415.1 membrane dipeptidase [Panacibacter sp.]